MSRLIMNRTRWTERWDTAVLDATNELRNRGVIVRTTDRGTDSATWKVANANVTTIGAALRMIERMYDVEILLDA